MGCSGQIPLLEISSTPLIIRLYGRLFFCTLYVIFDVLRHVSTAHVCYCGNTVNIKHSGTNHIFHVDINVGACAFQFRFLTK
jgi:hypothetical protein